LGSLKLRLKCVSIMHHAAVSVNAEVHFSPAPNPLKARCHSGRPTYTSALRVRGGGRGGREESFSPYQEL